MHYLTILSVYCLGGSEQEDFVGVHVQTDTVLIRELTELFSCKGGAEAVPNDLSCS